MTTVRSTFDDQQWYIQAVASASPNQTNFRILLAKNFTVGMQCNTSLEPSNAYLTAKGKELTMNACNKQFWYIDHDDYIRSVQNNKMCIYTKKKKIITKKCPRKKNRRNFQFILNAFDQKYIYDNL